MNDQNIPPPFGATQKTSETTATQSSEETETYTWMVMKCDWLDDGKIQLTEVGELVSDSSYWPYQDWSGIAQREALEKIARAGRGPGDYLLIHDERAVRVSIVAETVYRLASEES